MPRALGFRPTSEVVALEIEARQGGRVLVLDDADDLRTDVTRALSGHAECLVYSDLEGVRRELAAGDADILVTRLNACASSGPGAIPEMLAEHDRAVRWLLLAPESDAEEIDSLGGPVADEILLWPTRDVLFRQAIDRLLQLRRLSIQGLFLRETVRIMEDCRPLAYCLEPGQLYPLALEQLLRATHRKRGFALFHRDNLPRKASVAVRGFDSSQESRVCDALMTNKSIDLEAFEGISVVGQGELLVALRKAGVEVSDLLAISMGGQGPEAGIVCLLADGEDFDPDDVEKADIVARHGMAALGNAEAYAFAKERAFVDDLTQAYNSRYLLETCQKEIKRAERYGTPLSLLFLDLDQFKGVNDEHGHLAGSESLRRLCRVLEQCVREVDTLARYGGDEFAILLIDTDHETALIVAERIRRRVEEYIFEVARDVRLRLTLSVGVTTCPDHGVVRDHLLDLADKAMYRAKSNGRNRVCSASELD